MPSNDLGPVLRTETNWSVDRARPGDRVTLAVVMHIAKGYHINANLAQLTPYPDFTPYPTRLKILKTSIPLAVDPPQFPQAHSINVGFAREPLAVFDGRAIIYLPMVLPPDAAADKIQIRLALDYQACDAISCLLPQTVEMTTELSFGDDGPPPVAVNPDLFRGLQTEDGSPLPGGALTFMGREIQLEAPSLTDTWWLLLMAALGGFLLNLTPCVLPLIPIKILGLANAAQNRARCLSLGAATFLGVLIFWLALGIAIAAVSAMTTTSQLFQYPPFTILMGLVIAFMALGMIFTVNIPLPQFLYRLHPDQGTLSGAFGIGLLSAILSTPCTAPVMGAAAAWAATQNPGLTLAAFAAIGLGMALPYLLLSAAPGLLNRMPRSGPTGTLVKQTMGIFMLAAATYFLGAGLSGLLVKAPDPPSRIYWWGVMGCVAVGGFWWGYRVLQLTQRRWFQTLSLALGLLIIAAAVLGGMRFTDEGPIDWVYYTEKRYQDALEDGRSVVMVFTAAWCLNCKAQEQTVLRHNRIVERLRQKDVTPIMVDITGGNPAGKERLRRTGYLTIPLLVVYAPNGQEIWKRSYYTVTEVLDAIDTATGKPRPG